MAVEQLLYPLAPSIAAGILNYFYWRKQGYNSINTLILGCLLFYTAFYLLLKYTYFAQ